MSLSQARTHRIRLGHGRPGLRGHVGSAVGVGAAGSGHRQRRSRGSNGGRATADRPPSPTRWRDQGQGRDRHHPAGQLAQRGHRQGARRAKGLGSGQGTLAAYLGADIEPLQAAEPDDPGRHDGAAGAQGLRAPSSPASASTCSCCRPRTSPPTPSAPRRRRSRAQHDVDQGPAVREPAQPGELQPLIDDLQQPDQRGDQRHQRAGRHRARLHAGPVERQQQPPGPLEVVGADRRRGGQEGRQDVQQIRAILKDLGPHGGRRLGTARRAAAAGRRTSCTGPPRRPGGVPAGEPGDRPAVPGCVA